MTATHIAVADLTDDQLLDLTGDPAALDVDFDLADEIKSRRNLLAVLIAVKVAAGEQAAPLLLDRFRPLDAWSTALGDACLDRVLKQAGEHQ